MVKIEPGLENTGTVKVKTEPIYDPRREGKSTNNDFLIAWKDKKHLAKNAQTTGLNDQNNSSFCSTRSVGSDVC